MHVINLSMIALNFNLDQFELDENHKLEHSFSLVQQNENIYRALVGIDNTGCFIK